MGGFLCRYNAAKRAQRDAREVLRAFTPKADSHWTGDLLLREIITETANIKTFRFSPAEGDDLPFRFEAGQYVDLAVGVDGETIRRSYSISSSAEERRFIDLTIKREPKGVVSRLLCDYAKIGDFFPVRGPFGQFTFDAASASRVAFIGAGVGVTPLVSILRTLRDRNWRGEAFAVFGFRSEDDALFSDELSAIVAADFNLKLMISFSRPLRRLTKPKGRVSAKSVKRFIPTLKSIETFICGPTEMMDEMREQLQRFGVDPANLHFEAFSPPPVDPSLGGEFKLRFFPNDVIARSRSGESILDTAERVGVEIDYSCRNGSCGLCAANLNAGEIEMLRNDSLDDEEIERGNVLTCQSYPLKDCILTT